VPLSLRYFWGPKYPLWGRLCPPRVVINELSCAQKSHPHCSRGSLNLPRCSNLLREICGEKLAPNCGMWETSARVPQHFVTEPRGNLPLVGPTKLGDTKAVPCLSSPTLRNPLRPKVPLLNTPAQWLIHSPPLYMLHQSAQPIETQMNSPSN